MSLFSRKLITIFSDYLYLQILLMICFLLYWMIDLHFTYEFYHYQMNAIKVFLESRKEFH